MARQIFNVCSYYWQFSRVKLGVFDKIITVPERQPVVRIAS